MWEAESTAWPQCDVIGNRTRDLAACSIVPQQTILPRAPLYHSGPRIPWQKGAVFWDITKENLNELHSVSSQKTGLYITTPSKREHIRRPAFHAELNFLRFNLKRIKMKQSIKTCVPCLEHTHCNITGCFNKTLQWYSKYYRVASFTLTYTLIGVRIVCKTLKLYKLSVRL
jgi:hypothetical protein